MPGNPGTHMLQNIIANYMQSTMQHQNQSIGHPKVGIPLPLHGLAEIKKEAEMVEKHASSPSTSSGKPQSKLSDLKY